MEIIPANSPTFEIVHINAQRCDCGGRYQIHGQQLLEVDGNPIDRIRTSCERCEEERAFFFAVRGEAADDHFERTEASLRA
ncbi:MAG TPA: hypothetical protein ENN14_02310, partial [Chloroflexi bacterium]|nr:hypothetical protein [Chloroflexota bacterium]